MISKIGFIVLAIISCVSLYALDYLLKQDQQESSEQLHSFVNQTHEIAKSKSEARQKLEVQLMGEIARCQKNALQTHNAYVQLIHKAAPMKNGQPIIASEIIGDAASILTGEMSECKKTFDQRLQEGM